MLYHNFDPVLVDFGFIEIRWYSLAYIFGILLSWLYARKVISLLKQKNYYLNIKIENFDELIGYLIIGIILGGRIGYVLFYNLNYYLDYPLDIFMLWKGGMSFHGGLLGVIVSCLLFCRSKNLEVFSFLDIIACASPIGIFLGRIANFINGELFGKVTNLPWAIIFPEGGNVGRHPSQIYEAILEGVLLFIIINYFALKKDHLIKKGFVSGLFLFFYSIFRMISEIFRAPDPQVGLIIFNSMSMGTFLSIFLIMYGIYLMVTKKYNQ